MNEESVLLDIDKVEYIQSALYIKGLEGSLQLTQDSKLQDREYMCTERNQKCISYMWDCR